jgi:5-(carboxyamino)imidazole ribonucleotide mutase
MTGAPAVRVGVIMGSSSDWSVMEHASITLTELGIEHETKVVSAHRMPVEMAEYGQTAADRGLHCIIAGAGGAAHLPGMIAANTLVPVLGVPIPSTALQGVDSLYSIVQMPAGVPVATFAIGRPGAINAALFAGAMFARAGDEEVAYRLASRRLAAHAAALESSDRLTNP